MRIHFLLVKELFRGGGIETYTREVGSRLAKRGHEVTVYSTAGKEHCSPTWKGIKIVWLPKLRPYWTEKFLGAVMATYQELTNRRPDIVHLHSVAAGAMAAILRCRQVPCIVQMHGVEWQRSSWSVIAKATLKTLEQCSIAFADSVTAVSKTQCDYYAARYGTVCDYIPTAVEPKERVIPRLILEIGLVPRKYLFFAARLVPEKGAHYLIPAFRRMRTDFALVIAGGSANSEAYRRELSKLAGNDDRIRFVGDVRDDLLNELFSNAAAFVQPSELEGLSIGLIEAMSYGLPCVASDIPENREVVGQAALLFRNKAVDDLARALEEVLRNGGAAAELGLLARRRVAELYSWDNVVDQLESLYARVAEEKRRKYVPLGRTYLDRNKKVPQTLEEKRTRSATGRGQ